VTLDGVLFTYSLPIPLMSLLPLSSRSFSLCRLLSRREFLTARRYASAVCTMAMAMCPCPPDVTCLSSIEKLNESSWSLARELPSICTLCFKEIINSKNKGTFLWNSGKFRHGVSMALSTKRLANGHTMDVYFSIYPCRLSF